MTLYTAVGRRETKQEQSVQLRQFWYLPSAPDQMVQMKHRLEELNMNFTLCHWFRLWGTASNKTEGFEYKNKNVLYNSEIYDAYTSLSIMFPKALNQQMPAPPQMCHLVPISPSESLLDQCSSLPSPSHGENSSNHPWAYLLHYFWLVGQFLLGGLCRFCQEFDHWVSV